MAIGRRICWEDVKSAWIATFIVMTSLTQVKNNCCVLRKSVGGEFVTTPVKMLPGWPVRLCIAAGLTRVEAPHTVEAESSQKYTLRCLAMYTLALLACGAVRTYCICGDHKQWLRSAWRSVGFLSTIPSWNHNIDYFVLHVPLFYPCTLWLLSWIIFLIN